MSWSISFKTTSKEEAQATLDAEAESNLQFPAWARDAAKAAVDAIKVDGYISVESHGHHMESGTSGCFRIDTVE